MNLDIARYDDLTTSFCDQRIAQIERWEKEIGESDLMKWDISPLRIIYRLEHNFVLVLSDKAAAKARNTELQESAKKGEVFQLLIMVRSKFTNQRPYKEKGECYCIYKWKGLTE